MPRIEPYDREETLECGHCGGDVRVVYGDLYEDEAGRRGRVGTYSAHWCQGRCERSVLLAIGTQEPSDTPGAPPKIGASLQVRASASEFQMRVLDSAASPYAETGELGRVLNREELLAHPLKEWFFHSADHIVAEEPRVNGWLTEQSHVRRD